MKLLIKDVVLIQKGSINHNKKKDILIVDGIITHIADHIDESKSQKIISGKRLHCSIGLCDVGTLTGEPGFEHRETIHSVTLAARKGGFTALCIFPNHSPVTQSKATIKFLTDHNDRNHVALYPLGALSQDLNGKDINEYMDMVASGAVGFSDGLQSVSNTKLLDRAMLYAWNAGVPLVLHPNDVDLSHEGQMYEGITSTSLGMRGIPDIAETQMIQRDIAMLTYNEGHIIEYGISSDKSIKILKKAKAEGIKVNATVPYLNLLKNDESLTDFDTYLKVKPVLRSENDRKALIQGLKDDTIDVIVSNHVPLDTEAKDLEFPYAKFGAAGLETCLSALIDGLSHELDLETIVEKLTVSPRKLFNIEIPTIKEGEKANICVFDLDANWIYSEENAKSISINNPYLGHHFKSKVIATIIGEDVLF